MAQSSLSRRRFLNISGAAVSALALAACAPAVAPGSAAEAPADSAAPVAETGGLWVILKQDFHPSYNEFLRTKMTEYAESKGWAIEITDSAGYATGTGEIEKLSASVQAGEPPDVVNHDSFSSAQVLNL